jgi:hypothetical protein
MGHPQSETFDEGCPSCRAHPAGQCAFCGDMEMERTRWPDGKVPFSVALEIADNHGLLTAEMRREWLAERDD